MTVSVANKGNATLNMQGLNVTDFDDGVSFSVSPSSAFTVAAVASAAVTVTFTAVAGAQGNTLTDNDPKNPSVTVALSGTGATAPQISVTPASLSFGSVAVGQSSTLALTVANKGNATLNVTGLNTAAPFAVVSAATPFTVAAGANTVVMVKFSAVTGAQTGALAIASNDPAQPNLTVPLSGTGTTPIAPSSGESVIRTIVYNQISNFTTRLNITGPGRGASYPQPALGSNGTRLAFAISDSSGMNEIYVMNSDGTGQLEVDHYAPECFCGSWVDLSSDGSVIVSSDHVQLRLVNATGSGFKKLADNRSITDFRITGSGTKIYFVNSRGDASTTDPGAERGVYSINPDGTGLFEVAGAASVAKLLGVTTATVGNFTGTGPSLSISADGSRIVFTAQVGSQQSIFAVNSTGSGLRHTGSLRQCSEPESQRRRFRVAYYVSVRAVHRMNWGAINFDGSGRL